MTGFHTNCKLAAFGGSEGESVIHFHHFPLGPRTTYFSHFSHF